MMYFNFKRFFKLKGIARPFSHLRAMGYSDNYATKLANNHIYQINIARLEKFCHDFNCTPNDLIDFRPYTDRSIPENHALRTLTKNENPEVLMAKIFELSPDKIQQIHNIIENME